MLKNLRKTNGITLIALIITIIVLLILAGVTIAAISSNESAPQKAVEARNENEIGAAKDLAALKVEEKIQKYYEDKYVNTSENSSTPGEFIRKALKEAVTEGNNKISVNNKSIIKVTDLNDNEIVKGTVNNDGTIDWDNKDGLDLVKSISDLIPESSTAPVELLSDKKDVVVLDDNDKEVVIPKGFGIAYTSATTIEGGVVIQDANNGNQFVWVPVNTTVNYSNEYKTSSLYASEVASGRENGNSGVIQLARYDFGSNSSPTLIPKSGEDIIQNAFEVSHPKKDSENKEVPGSAARDIDGFVTNTTKNKGFYIGRYENGRGGVIKSGVFAQGNQTRDGAKSISRNMYGVVNGCYTSDLINSFAWDTAVVFAIKCGNNPNYAFRKGNSGSPTYCGSSGDVQCNIHDLGGNVIEFTTESGNSGNWPNLDRYTVVQRGGWTGNDDLYTSRRYTGYNTTNSGDRMGFRTIIYFIN